jgi:hypothetical protein
MNGRTLRRERPRCLVQKNHFIFLLVLLLLSHISVGQTGEAQTTTTTTPEQQSAQPAAAQQQKSLSNDDVIGMVAAGLPDEIIIAKIRNSQTSFDLSTPALAKLTPAKISSAVIKAMIEPKASDSGTPGATAAPALANPDDPMAPHDPGVYLMAVTRSGVKKMVQLERAGSSHEKTANVWGHAFSYGISKAKVKAELPGRQAAIRSNQEKPEFYMYFPPTGNLGAADTVTSPSQFSLLSLEEKKDHRETAVLKLGFASASSGTDEKRNFKFDADKIRSYAYKVTPSGNLKNGEYAFIAFTSMGGAATAGGVMIFDFGMDLK